MSEVSERDRFLEQVKDHVMTIELNQGVHRCLHFGVPGSVMESFRLITYQVDSQ